MNLVEKYNWFGSKVVHVFTPPGSDVSIGVEADEPSKWYVTALKILTMIITAGVLPLLALIIKAIARCCCTKDVRVIQVPGGPGDPGGGGSGSDPLPFHADFGRRDPHTLQSVDESPSEGEYSDNEEEVFSRMGARSVLPSSSRSVMEPGANRFPPSTASHPSVALHQQLIEEQRSRSAAQLSAASRAQPSRSAPTAQQLADQAIAQDEVMFRQILARAQALQSGASRVPLVDPRLGREAHERSTNLCRQNQEAGNLYSQAAQARIMAMQAQCPRVMEVAMATAFEVGGPEMATAGVTPEMMQMVGGLMSSMGSSGANPEAMMSQVNAMMSSMPQMPSQMGVPSFATVPPFEHAPNPIQGFGQIQALMSQMQGTADLSRLLRQIQHS